MKDEQRLRLATRKIRQITIEIEALVNKAFDKYGDEEVARLADIAESLAQSATATLKWAKCP